MGPAVTAPLFTGEGATRECVNKRHKHTCLPQTAQNMAMLTRALSIGVVRKIAWGGDPDAAQRTTHDNTVKQRFDQL